MTTITANNGCIRTSNLGHFNYISGHNLNTKATNSRNNLSLISKHISSRQKPFSTPLATHQVLKSKGSVSQLMDDLDLINSVEQVEAMVNSIQKGVENVLRK